MADGSIDGWATLTVIPGGVCGSKGKTVIGASSGSGILWTQVVDSNTTAIVVTEDGDVGMVGTSNSLYALSMKLGIVTSSLPYPVASMVVQNSTVLAAGANGSLVSIDVHTGLPTGTVQGICTSLLTIAPDCTLLCFDATTNTVYRYNTSVTDPTTFVM